MSRSASLLAQAEALYDGGVIPPPTPGGFAQGAEWMRRSLQILRGESIPPRPGAYDRAGLAKYGLCLVGGALGGVPGLYAIEAQLVFLFPLLIDGVADPIVASRALTRRAGGTASVMRTVLPIAARMLSGGPRGQGAIRSWALGCLAILIWYESIDGRTPPPTGPWADLGGRAPLWVRTERIAGLRAERIVFASDLHLSGPWTQRAAEQLIETAGALRPDGILLGGDLVDTRGGLSRLQRCVRALSRLAPVAAVGGNHDAWVGTRAVRRSVERGGGRWLVRDRLAIGGAIVGGVGDRGASIWLAHHPDAFEQAPPHGIRLVLAGHLHGGQVVLWRGRGRTYPGAFLSRYNGPRFERGGSTLVVSRGVNDTLPVRFRCPREVVLVEAG